MSFGLGSPAVFDIAEAIRPAVGRIPKVVRLFTLRQSTSQILSYKAGNDDVFSLFHAETD